jgi:hypothetical protein
MRRNWVHLSVAAMIVAAMSVTMVGCGSKEKKSKKPASREGTVREVNKATREVAMNTFVKSLNKDTVLSGTLEANAEIYIDGKIASLDDVQIGDRVVAEGVKKGDKFIVTRATITRRPAGEAVAIEKPAATTQPVSGQ